MFALDSQPGIARAPPTQTTSVCWAISSSNGRQTGDHLGLSVNLNATED